jgi:hypothetical protein
MDTPLKIPQSSPRQVFIKSVIMRDGKDYDDDWKAEMYEVVTDVGTYIATTIRKQQQKVQNGLYVEWDKRIGQSLEVFTNFDGKFHWINSIEPNDDPNAVTTSMTPLTEAIKKGLPELKCFVYRLEVGGENYIGFTSKEPKVRLEEHLEAARNDSPQKVHKALRRFGEIHTFEVLSEHTNEVEALVAEIITIKKFDAKLNVSIGGEGNNYSVVESYNHLKEKVFFVQTGRRPKNTEPLTVRSEPSISDAKSPKRIHKESPEEVLIREVVKHGDGTKFKDEWKIHGMFEVKTEVGDYVASQYADHQSENIDLKTGEKGFYVNWHQFEGKKLKIWTYPTKHDPNLYWIVAAEKPLPSFVRGKKVEHKTWGVGLIKEVQQRGSITLLTIDFSKHGLEKNIPLNLTQMDLVKD